MNEELEFLIAIEAACAKYGADIQFDLGGFSFSVEDHAKREIAKLENPASNVVQLHPQ